MPNEVGMMTQGHEAVYKKLREDPIDGFRIAPDWYITISSSEPYPVESICRFYLEQIRDGEVDNPCGDLVRAAEAFRHKFNEIG